MHPNIERIFSLAFGTMICLFALASFLAMQAEMMPLVEGHNQHDVMQEDVHKGNYVMSDQMEGKALMAMVVVSQSLAPTDLGHESQYVLMPENVVLTTVNHHDLIEKHRFYVLRSRVTDLQTVYEVERR